MAKFLIKDRIACWVTYRYVVEGETEDEAQEKWMDGDMGHELSPLIKDSIDFLDGSVDIQPYEENER
jgi:hypothetical protein